MGFAAASVRALAIPLLCSGAVTFLITVFFAYLYFRIRTFREHAPERHAVFSLLSLADTVFLLAFGVLVATDPSAMGVKYIAHRITIISSSAMMAFSLHFFAAFFLLSRVRLVRRAIATAYVTATAFLILFLVPSRPFASTLVPGSSRWHPLDFSYDWGMGIWAVWEAVTMSASLGILAYGTVRALRHTRAAGRPPIVEGYSPREGASVIIAVSSCGWIATGLADELTALRVLDLPPLNWIGSMVVVLTIGALLCGEIATLFKERRFLYDELIRDALTGAYSRGYFDIEYAKSVAASRRALTRLYLAIVDLDDFKLVNDEHGHKAGDDALRAVAMELARHVRPGDVVARYGGDEFVVLPRQVLKDEDAKNLCDRLGKGVLNLRFGKEGLKLSCSVGAARIDPEEWSENSGESATELFRRADLALYAAKRAGKGRYLFFEDARLADTAAPAGPTGKPDEAVDKTHMGGIEFFAADEGSERREPRE